MIRDYPGGDRMDRHLRDELSPAEARELAQASLDSPEMFAELSDSALAKAALYSRPLPSDKVLRFPRRRWFLMAGAATAAAAVVLTLTVMKPARVGNPGLKPVLAVGASAAQPVLLASGLKPAATDRDGAPVFRSPQTDSRAPRAVGSIVAIEDGEATVDLGSLDGVTKGSELQVFRDDRSNQAIGRLQVTAAFREHARGRIVDGQKFGASDRVCVDDATHLNALLQQVDALYSRGDADSAYQAAEQASRWMANANVPPARQSELWNQLAVLRTLRGDYHDAEASLSHAVSAAPKFGLTYAQSMNNLGVLAEMRGDRRTSESRYADALRALAAIPDAPEQERRSIEGNLARLRGR